jgi:predicted RNase H-like HicB family nuclease
MRGTQIPEEWEYQTIVRQEILSDGRLVYMASHPELRRCRAQGDTSEEALEFLSEVYQDYMEHLQEYGLPIPRPRNHAVQRVIWNPSERRTFVAAMPVGQLMTIFEPIVKPYSTAFRAGENKEMATSGTR